MTTPSAARRGRSAAALAAAACGAAGMPSFRLKVPNGDRVPCVGEGMVCRPKELDYQPEKVCRGVGHQFCKGGTFPLNAFGAGFLAAGHKWTKEFCEQDSDGDGQTNGFELGDPCCEWEASDGLHAGLLAWTPSDPANAQSTTNVPGAAARDAQCEKVRQHATGVRYVNGFFANEQEVQKKKEFLVDDYRIQSQTPTTYTDFGWNFTDPDCDGPDGCYIVGIDAVINSKYVHHYVLDLCSPDDPPLPAGMDGKVWKETIVTQYTSGLLAITQSRCRGMMGGWAPGQEPMMRMSPTSGIYFGKDRPLTGFEVNIHYDNQNLDEDGVDTSGFVIYYTTTKRPDYFNIVSGIQLSYSPSMTIPIGHKRFFIANRCRMAGLPENGALMLDTWWHAHLRAREMYAQVFPSEGGKVRERKNPRSIWNEQTWYFDDQYRYDLSPQKRRLFNGDELQAVCVMDTDGLAEPLRINEETTDEMCWSLLSLFTPAADVEGSRARAWCTNGVSWTGTLAPDDDASRIQQLHPAPAQGCGLDLQGQAVVMPRRMGGKTVILDVAESCDDGVDADCCNILRNAARKGCMCDPSFLGGQGYLTAGRMRELRAASSGACGVDEFAPALPDDMPACCRACARADEVAYCHPHKSKCRSPGNQKSWDHECPPLRTLGTLTPAAAGAGGGPACPGGDPLRPPPATEGPATAVAYVTTTTSGGGGTAAPAAYAALLAAAAALLP